MVTQILDQYLCDICHSKTFDRESAEYCEEEGIFSFPDNINHIPFRLKDNPKKIVIVQNYNPIVTRSMADHYAYHDILILSPSEFDNNTYIKEEDTVNLSKLHYTLETLSKKEVSQLTKKAEYQEIILPKQFPIKGRKELYQLISVFERQASNIHATLRFAEENGMTSLEETYNRKLWNLYKNYNPR